MKPAGTLSAPQIFSRSRHQCILMALAFLLLVCAFANVGFASPLPQNDASRLSELNTLAARSTSTQRKSGVYTIASKDAKRRAASS